jgi:hypothetical protein
MTSSCIVLVPVDGVIKYYLQLTLSVFPATTTASQSTHHSRGRFDPRASAASSGLLKARAPNLGGQYIPAVFGSGRTYTRPLPDPSPASII